MQAVVGLPEDEFGIYPIAVAQQFPLVVGADHIGNHFNALLFHAQGRYVFKADGLPAPHDSFQRRAAPAGKAGFQPGRQFGGIKAEYVDHHFQGTGVAHLQDGFSGLDHTFTFAVDVEQCSGDR